MKGKIFNTNEVQAIIAGNKTMFREVIKPYPILSEDKSYWEFKGVRWAGENSSYAKNFGDNARPVMPDLCSYQVGQEIFVKERFFVSNYIELRYEANLSIDEKYYWLPAIKMKQEHSRLTLEITDVKVERLGEISEEDCHKEGAVFIGKKTHKKEHGFEPWWHVSDFSARGYFHRFWNATHKKPEEKFEANPFVWVVGFKINK